MRVQDGRVIREGVEINNGNNEKYFVYFSTILCILREGGKKNG